MAKFDVELDYKGIKLSSLIKRVCRLKLLNGSKVSQLHMLSPE